MILLSIIAIFIFYLIYPISQAIKISDAMLAKTVRFEQHPPNPNKRILVAGDSTAIGVGAKHPNESIAGRLGKQFPEADITNLGKSGAKLKDLLPLLRGLDHHYDLIVLQVGANDITHFTSFASIKQALTDILTLSQSISSKTIILSAGNVGKAPMFRWPLSMIFSYRTRAIRDIFMEEIAKSKTAAYVDLYTKLANDPRAKDVKQYYASDQFHLSSYAYAIWYSYIEEKLND